MFWGVSGTNYGKNVTLDGCKWSRFDAHQGVGNVTILNSEIGHAGLSVVGAGLLYVENTTIHGSSFLTLRSDYGATWEGDLVIKNCTWDPGSGEKVKNGVTLIGGWYRTDHDFGYDCYMPASITIEGLKVLDKEHVSNYKGPYLIGDFVSSYTSDRLIEKLIKYGQRYYHFTEKVTISGYESESGMQWILSPNQYMNSKIELNDLDA